MFCKVDDALPIIGNMQPKAHFQIVVSLYNSFAIFPMKSVRRSAEGAAGKSCGQDIAISTFINP